MDRNTPSPSSLITPVALWRVEDGSESAEYAGPDICHAAVIEQPERESLWYTQHFLGKDHSNWVGVDDTFGPFAFSLLREDLKARCILWLPSGAQNATINIPLSEPLTAIDAMRRSGWNMSKKKLKEMKKGEMLPSTGLDSSVSSLASSSSTISQVEKERGISSTMLSKWEVELTKIENKMASRFQNYKFGILYVKAGQKTEEEMFSNRVSSIAFRDFCQIIGDKIELKDWPFFSGGLDTKSDRTGRHSLYTQHCGYDIMFHVSTMLPWNDSDQQQIDRKRHIGNDVVIIAFIDEDAKDLWCPTIVSSRFPHLYAVVKPVTAPNGATGYHFNLAVKDTVSSFGPPLPQPPIFYDPATFRIFLLSKLINGEREAIRTVNDFHQNSAYLSDLQDLYEKASRAANSSNSTSTPEKSSSKDATYSDSIVGLHSATNPHLALGSLSSLGSSSPNLFHHALHNSSSISRDAKEGREAMLSGMGGSFQLSGSPLSSSSRDLFKGHLLGGAGSGLASSGSGKLGSPVSAGGSGTGSPALPQSSSRLSLVTVPLSIPLEDGLLKKSLQTPPLALYAATEQMQAFQNKPALLNFPAEITCAETWEDRLIVGSVDGLFLVDLNHFGTKTNPISEINCLVHKGQPYRHNCYLQLAVIEELNIMLALVSKVGVLMYDLTSLLSPGGPSELVLRKTKGATTFSLGGFQNALHLAVSTPRGIVIHRWTNDAFNLSQIIQLPPLICMEFDSKGFIIAASAGEYYFVKPDPESPTMNSLYSWSDKERSLEPVSVLLFEDTSEYLLCFDLVGFFVNSVGHKTRNYEFKWLATPVSLVSVYPYLLVFTQQHLEVRYLSNGALVQLFELDTRYDSQMKFMTTGNGICFASISASNKESAPSATLKENKDLTSSSSSSNAAVTPSTTSNNKDSVGGPIQVPTVSFNSTRSTIHILRLNSLQTCVVSNPAALVSTSPSFIVHGLIHSVGSSSAPSSPAIPIPHGISHKKLNLGRKVASSAGSGGAPSTAGDASAGSSPHSPGGLLQYMINEGTASFDDSDEVFRMASEDGGSVYYRRKSPGRDQRSSMTIGSLGSNGSGSTNTSTPSNQASMLTPGQLTSMLRFKSSDDFPGGSPSKTSFRNYGDDAVPPGRISTSAKIARRKSLALETEHQSVRRKQHGHVHRRSSGFSEDFDFEFEPPVSSASTKGSATSIVTIHGGRSGTAASSGGSRKDFSESSESPRKEGRTTSPIATPTSKKKRGASDKLSGSSERSPRSSPTIATPDTLKEFADRRSKKKQQTTTLVSREASLAAADVASNHSRTTSGSNDSDNVIVSSSALSAASDSVVSPRNKSTSALPIITRAHTELDSKPSRKSVGAALNPPELPFSAAVLHTSTTSASASPSASASSVTPANASPGTAWKKTPGVQFDPVVESSPSMSRAAKRKSASSAMSAQIANLSAALNEDYLASSGSPASSSPSTPPLKVSKPRHASSTRSLSRPLNMEEGPKSPSSSSKRKTDLVSPRASRKSSSKSPDKSRLNAIDLGQVASQAGDSSITASSDSPVVMRKPASPRSGGPTTTTTTSSDATSSLPPTSPTPSKKDKRASERRTPASSSSVIESTTSSGIQQRKSVGRAPSEEPSTATTTPTPTPTPTTTTSSSKKVSEAPTSSTTPPATPPVRRVKSSILTPVSASDSSEGGGGVPTKKEKKDKKDKKEKDKN